MSHDDQTLNIKSIGDGGLGGMGGLGGGMGAILLLALLGRGNLLGGENRNCESVATSAALGDIRGNITGLAASVNQIERQQDTSVLLAALKNTGDEVRVVGSEVRATNAAVNAVGVALAREIGTAYHGLTSSTNAGFVALDARMNDGFARVIAAQVAGVQTIKDTLCMDRENALRDQNITLKDALSNAKQTDHLEHFMRHELDRRFDSCRRELRDSVVSAVSSGNSAGGVGSGNGSNNTSYELNFAQGFQRGLAAATKTA